MAMLLQQIRRAAFARRGTSALTPPPHAFSRFCSSSSWTSAAEWKKLDAELENEWEAFIKAEKELDALRSARLEESRK